MQQSMRGVFTPVTKIRREIFTAVARFAYKRDLHSKDKSELYKIPFRISPGETAQYRDSVFIEREVARERVRLAMGLPLRTIGVYMDYADGFEEIDQDVCVETMPVVNVISFACQACPTKTYRVSMNCRRCIAHPCTSACPKRCIKIGPKGAIIDEDVCIRCGRCKDACPYGSILLFDRPCALACGVDAIGSDQLGRAVIDEQKCVSCGLCMANCPFGAIADKSEILQVINAIRAGKRMIAAVAPAFAGQFGALATPNKILNGIKALGFTDVVEVSLGADVSSLREAEHFVASVPGKQPFMGTSCCTSWEAFARKSLPGELGGYISTASTPMVATAEIIKERYPDAVVVFVGPCVAKKTEALEEDVKPYIDFVLTFEELMGMFVAQKIELNELPDEFDSPFASTEGRNYAVAAGVAGAIASCIKVLDPERAAVPLAHADTLRECKKMLQLAKVGKLNGHLIEGMACPGGCVGGAGTLATLAAGTKAVHDFAAASAHPSAMDNPLTTAHK